MAVAPDGAVPSLDHEAPLVVLREEPSLVPALLREALGIELPPFERAEVGNADFTQALPTEFRADLVVYLRGASPRPIMAIVVEVQRRRDGGKRATWPLYVAALHASARCPTCLVVVATSEAVARWAAAPITTLQPGSPFVPLVVGPSRVPVVDAARARHDPWMAILSALLHGQRDSLTITRATLESTAQLPGHHANFYFDLVMASLGGGARHRLEVLMNTSTQKAPSPKLKRLAAGWIARGEAAARKEGRKEGRDEGTLETARELLLAIVERRLGAVSEAVRAQIEARKDAAALSALVVEIGAAPDRKAVEAVVASLAPKAAVSGRRPAKPGPRTRRRRP